jgi:fatty-acyl-CoA synthase
MTHGATMVYPNDAFDPLTVLQTVQEERCTGLYGVPTMFIAELDHPRFAEFDISSLRTGIMAGSPCPIEVMKRVQALMHMHQVTIAYGMTETSPVSTQSAVDDPLEKRVSTVGRVQPHLEVKIADEQGRPVPVGVTGELCTRGYSVMLGYWGDPAKTAEAVDAEGWMHTGDLATMDAEGYVNIVGRLRNNNYEKDGETVYGMAFTAEEIDYLDSRAESEARRNGGQGAEGLPPARSGEQAAPAASTRKPRSARQPAHADA